MTSEEPPLLVKRHSRDATLPTKGSPLSAGFDLFASQPAIILPGERKIIQTGISIACPPGTYGRIAPRLGMAFKNGITCGAGVIDADYRGPIGVVLFNHDKENAFRVQKGDMIARLFLEKISMAGLKEVHDLDDAERVLGRGVGRSLGVEPEFIHDEIILNFDGASRNNPYGPAACGWIIRPIGPNGIYDTEIAHGSKYLGHNVSSNQAEYRGLCIALKFMVKYRVKCYHLTIQGDSELVINHLRGIYQVRNGNMMDCYRNTQSKLEEYKLHNPQCRSIDFEHIDRFDNHIADRLANDAIEEFLRTGQNTETQYRSLAYH